MHPFYCSPKAAAKHLLSRCGLTNPSTASDQKTRLRSAKAGLREGRSPLREGRQAGQSLLELAVFFPILLMLVSGVVEFGFMLNQYLNLIDGPREAARFAVTQNPFIGTVGSGDNPCFYSNVAAETLKALNPIPTNPVVQLNSSQDDVVISVFSINSNVVTRYPAWGHLTVAGYNCVTGAQDESADNTVGEWHLYGLGSSCDVNVDLNCHPSRFTSADVLARVTATNGGAIPPSMGVVLVEVYYGYNQILKLPWLAFVGDPIRVYTYTMMPIPAAAP